MQILVNYGDIEGSDTISDHVRERVEHALGHNMDRVTRVEVHLRDDKQKRRGEEDKRCTMEARIAGMQPLAVEHRTRDVYEAASGAADKLGRAVAHKIERAG